MNPVNICHFIKLNLFMKTLRNWNILPLFLILVFGCSEEEKPNCVIDRVDGDPKTILGTWQVSKLIEFDFSNGKRHSIDFSCKSITITFFQDGEYLVEGEGMGFSWIQEDTKFSFEYGEVTGMFGNSTLKIGDKIVPCFIDKSEMIWDESWVDGDSYEFYRVRDNTDEQIEN